MLVNKTGEIQWYARGGDIAEAGPFKTQVEAWKAMRYSKSLQERYNMIHPSNTMVWPEYNEENLSIEKDPYRVEPNGDSYWAGYKLPCCDNERRNWNGGCDNCGDPCL